MLQFDVSVAALQDDAVYHMNPHYSDESSLQNSCARTVAYAAKRTRYLTVYIQ